MTAKPHRSVLFITADQWQAACLSRLGHSCVRTPNLDRLAAEGVLFAKHYSQCSPCGPARASLLTGLYMMNHRSVRNGTPLDARHTNIALEVRKAGYDPTLFGYTDTSPDPRALPPRDPSLCTYEGMLPGMSAGCRMTEEMRPWRADLRAKGYEVPTRPLDIFKPASEPSTAESPLKAPRPIYSAEDSDTAFLADQALRYLSIARGEPWFVHLVFLRPHPPLIAPEPYNMMYDPSTVPAPTRAASADLEATQHPYLAHLLARQREPGYLTGHNVSLQALDDGEARVLAVTYYGLITEVDHHIGRVIDLLKETGEYDNTLIVFTVDHGEMLGDHWLYGKEGYFDQAYHIPLIIRDPRPEADAARGGTVRRFTEAIDVMPTILDWLGLDVPVECDGNSLLPFLDRRAPGVWRRAAHWEFDFRDIEDGSAEAKLNLLSDQCSLSVIRDDRYKYVHFAALPPLFFDLREDPGEFRDLTPDPAYQGLILEYAQRMLSWRMVHDERVLTNMFLSPGGVIERRTPRVVS